MSIDTLHLAAVLEHHTRDLTGRTAAVTGTTSGTGFVLARELGRLGAEVLLLNRASARADAALGRLRAAVPGATFRPIVCDLQDFESVRAAAQAVAAHTDTLDILCNNAGVMALPDRATADGHDVQMQTNVISHFLLTRELMPLLRRSADARIVNHTSMARLGPDLEARYFERRGGDLGGDGTAEDNARFSGPRWARYHQTKLANCAFTYELKRRLEAAGLDHVKVALAHPGLAATNLQVTTSQTGGMAMGGEFMSNAQSAEDGALGILRGCADPDHTSGDFYGPQGWTGFPERLPPEAPLSSAHNRATNWQGCEAAVGAFDL